MTAGEFNELAKQGRVWAKIVANTGWLRKFPV